MSWSNSWIGRRSGIKAAMARYRDTLTGNSQKEFDEARQHLEALVDMNSKTEGGDPIIHLDASGHAYRVETGGYSQVSVRVEGTATEVSTPYDLSEGHIVLCTCPMITGGHRVLNPSCPMHRVDGPRDPQEP